MKVWAIPYTTLYLFLIVSVLNHSSYVKGIHDCSNMATEQYNFFSNLGLDTYIVVGEYENYHHSWIKINNYEYDAISLLPIQLYNIGNKPVAEPEYFKMNDDNNYSAEWQTHYSSYYRSIIMLFILILYNILCMKVIYPVIHNAYA